MRRFVAGLIVGAGLTWLGVLAMNSGRSLGWYHWLIAAAGVLVTASGVELYLRLRAERELKAAGMALSFLGVPGLVLLVLAVVLALV